MERIQSSQRTLKWKKRNSITEESCLNYVKKILERYGLEDYEVEGKVLRVKDFLIYIDEQKVCLVVKKIIGKYKKEYTGDTCWMRAIQDIVNG